jgi:hypothetical protein
MLTVSQSLILKHAIELKKEDAREGGKRKPIKDEDEDEDPKKDAVATETRKDTEALEASETTKQPQEIIIRAPQT